MKKPFDPYVWSKNRIKILVDKIQTLKNDGLDVSDGDVWSIKKLLLLDYYVKPFVTIIRKNCFNNWYYVDTHCGSGLIGFDDDDLKNECFPGSPLIVALRGKEYSFHEYIFSDIKTEKINALKKRLGSLKHVTGNLNHSFNMIEFKKTVELVETKKQKGNAFLIFIDPIGFKEITWNLMEKLLSIQTADIIFTFMTYVIALNRSKADSDIVTAQLLDEFFGNNNWNNCEDGETLAELYKQQMSKFKKYTYTIPVYQTGERILYHMIIATNSKGASNVFDDARRIMDVTTTELFRDALKVISGKTKDLTEFY
jgi:three-Cys-motif partner protein